MQHLGQAGFRALLNFLRGSYAVRDLEGFRTYVLSALPQLVPSEITTYNEVDFRRRQNTLMCDPPGATDFPDSHQIFNQHIRDHPLILHYWKTADPRPLMISDFLTQNQFHSTGLYSDFYRRVRVKHQLAFTLKASQTLLVGVALNRPRRGFSERDRLLLDLIRPHLIQAFQNAEAATQMTQEAKLARRALEETDRGMILLDRGNLVRLMTLKAEQWLAKYFPLSLRRNRLPEAIQRWVRYQQRLLVGTEALPPQRPLVVEQQGKRLVVRLLSDLDQSLLLLEEDTTTPPSFPSGDFGLTAREAEVLVWVAQGKTNSEIGALLTVSPRTVQKHLERIFQKLGVETRTAAASRAWGRDGKTSPAVLGWLLG